MDIFEDLAREKQATIGIGLGTDKVHNQKLLEVATCFLKERKAKIVLFGKENSIEQISQEEADKLDKNRKIELVRNENPEKSILKYLVRDKLKAVVRGSLESSKFLANIKEDFHVLHINRLTLLETVKGHQFFYGPVGIDECNDFDKKKEFIEKSLRVFNSLKIDPKISVLSGGRKGDLGRDEIVDRTIEVADKVVEYFNKTNPGLNIAHDEILIEQAIQKKSNLVIAPEGISGNLIYRTLVHLGGGKAYGAIYMGLEKVIIDTSRVGPPSEIMGALLLALSLS
ncbi:MAG: methanogenesis marker protein Mmp4/MtxX [Candidatus Lokiarchaeota archaeon]|nr:methanogenesis marker protein Mmp4/MtxX [Candidatus Lokiarchaeota archaeon]